jgi:hypothetical protein
MSNRSCEKFNSCDTTVLVAETAAVGVCEVDDSAKRSGMISSTGLTSIGRFVFGVIVFLTGGIDLELD